MYIFYLNKYNKLIHSKNIPNILLNKTFYLTELGTLHLAYSINCTNIEQPTFRTPTTSFVSFTLNQHSNRIWQACTPVGVRLNCKTKVNHA